MTTDRLDRLRRSVEGALTTRGWFLLGASIAVLPIGRLIGIQELYGLGAAGLVAVLSAVVWTMTVRWNIEIEREVHPHRVASGERATVDLRAHNVALRTSPVITLHDPFGPARSGHRQQLAPIGPGLAIQHRMQLPPIGRGLYQVGPMTATLNDPFGLARCRRTVAPVERVVVYPAAVPLGAPILSGGTGRAGGRTITDSGSDNDEFASLREYRPGDDLRKVHWASSARSDTLLVREDERDRRGHVMVIVDLRSSMWTAVTLEAGLGVAAGVAEEALSSDMQFRLLGTDGTDSGLGSGLRHRARVLDALTVAELHRPGPLTIGSSAHGRRRVTGLGAGDTAVVVTSDRADAADVARVRELAQQASVTLIVVESAGGRRIVRPSPGRRSLRVIRVPVASRSTEEHTAS